MRKAQRTEILRKVELKSNEVFIKKQKLTMAVVVDNLVVLVNSLLG